MEFTLIGVITILISIYAFFKNEKLLLYLLVFLSTFTAAKLINITITTTPIITYEFTGAMWLLREFINFIKERKKISIDIIIKKFRENKLALAFLIFMIVIILSELHLAISGMLIEYTDADGNIVTTVEFCKTNITQAVLVLLVFTIMIALTFKIKKKEEAKELLKVFAISTVFAVLWGLLQFITYYLGIPYPAFLFNNNEYAVQWYNQIENNIKRICSIALEPSTFAVNLTCFIPFILGMFLKIKGKITTSKFNILVFVLLILTTVCAILTTSSTTYVGIVAVYGLYGVYILFGFIKDGELSNRKSNFIKLLVATLASIAVAGCLCVVCVKIGYKLGTIDYIVEEAKVDENDEKENKENNDEKETETEYNSAFDNMVATLKQMTIGKLSSGSGQERLNGEKIGIQLYTHSPLFGVGFGSYRTFSLFTNILVNTGILGIITFFYVLYVVIKELIIYRKKDETTSIMFLISIIATTIAFFVGVPDLILTYYWMIMVFGYKYATLDK